MGSLEISFRVGMNCLTNLSVKKMVLLLFLQVWLMAGVSAVQIWEEPGIMSSHNNESGIPKDAMHQCGN